MARRITILGMGPTAFERKIDIEKYCAGEIWGLNNGYLSYPHLKGKWGRFFELHAWRYVKDWDNGTSGKVDHCGALQELDCPVYSMEPLPLIEKQVRFPMLDACKHFKTNYFLGSPSLMLMLALYEHDMGQHVEYIESWGIDTSDERHGQQRASWAFWLRAAHDRGIDLGGSSTNFFAEYENDDGLRGLREHIGRLMQEQEELEK